MKTKLLMMAALCAGAFNANAQTKGTNLLGLGVSTSTHKSKSQNNESESKSSSFSLEYGHFIRDNQRIGLGLYYGMNKSNSSEEYDNYGINVYYQKYYPLVKKLYAYAGARIGYGESKQISNTNISNQTDQNYSLGAMGGLTWFVSKRFAFETNLLSADLYYGKTKYSSIINNNYQENSVTLFNLNTQGFIDDLGFKIYLPF